VTVFSRWYSEQEFDPAVSNLPARERMAHQRRRMRAQLGLEDLGAHFTGI